MIDTENLTKKFGALAAVEDVTLRIDEGEVFGFLGPNGSGKITTVRMLSCLISKTSGRAWIGDYEVGNSPDSQEIRRMIGLLPENVGLYSNLNAYQNFDFSGRLYKTPKELRSERIEYFLKVMGLWDKREQPAGTLSKGMRQKLAIAHTFSPSLSQLTVLWARRLRKALNHFLQPP
ncbi:MAG: ABC transporter ATP-binding protein [Theionarchaea archaeon]|nr:ABC transporter ATP-binding protein [Theionarchaea archaeon]